MIKITSQKLTKRLAKYGALSVAIASVAEVNGQNIIYTDLDPDEGGAGVNVSIDLDGGGADFLINNISSYSWRRMYPLQNVVGPGNAILGTVAFNSYFSLSLNYPAALNSGYAISSVTTPPEAWNSNYEPNELGFTNCETFFPNVNFCSATDKYIGVRFLIGGNFHYGWVRVDVIDGNNFFVKDYAYEASPGVAIVTPDPATLSVQKEQINKIKVVALSKGIRLYNLHQETSYKLFNMTGQEVLKGATNERDHVIEANALSSGVYIVELEDTDTNAVLRKKLVLQ